NLENLQYFTIINVGTPPRPFRSPIDISRSDMFTFSTECEDEACRGHYQYSPSSSKTHNGDGTPARFMYNGFRGTGHVSQDTLTIAGLQVRDQLFHELDQVTRIPTILWRHDFDSILGLAPPDEAWSLLRINNPFASMVLQSLLPRNVIYIALGATEGRNAVPGEINFGGINPEMFEGTIVDIPLSNVTGPDRGNHDPFETGPPLLNGPWRVEARGLSWGGDESDSYNLSGFTARLDTVESFIWLPSEVFFRLREIIQPDSIPFWLDSVNCSKIMELPDLTFNLGGQYFELGPMDYALEMEFGNLGNIDELDFTVLGTPFLRCYYNVLDFDRRSVGCEYHPFTQLSRC
ncbi:acid protease, partial [Lepidopterella palustris CBS 459.81]